MEIHELRNLLWEMSDAISSNMQEAKRAASLWPTEDREEYMRVLDRAREIAAELGAWGSQADRIWLG